MAGNDFIPWPFTNKPLGAARAAAYYFDADDYLDNFIAGSDVAGIRRIRGVNCVDKASAAGQCEIWLETHPGAGNGKRTVADVNDYALIYSAARAQTWLVQVQHGGAGTECYVVFSDAIGLQDPTAPTGVVYNNAAFIDGLDIYLFISDFQFKLPADFHLFSATSAGGINSDTIPRGTAIVAGSVEEGLDDIETAFGVDHNLATGDHSAEIIDNATLDVDCFAPDFDTYEGFENLVDGDFEYDDDGDGVANGWLPYNGPPTVQMTGGALGVRGQNTQSFTTLGAGPGIHAYADDRLHYLAQDFQNKTIGFAALVRSTVNDSIVLEINDGVGVTSRPVSNTAGVWQWLFMSRDMDALASTSEARIYANQACTIDVDGAVMKFGRLNIGYLNAPAGVSQRLYSNSDVENWLPNGHMEDFSRGLLPTPNWTPDFWTVTAGAPVMARNAAVYRYGQYSMQMACNLGDAVQIATLNPLDMREASPRSGQSWVSFFHFATVGNPSFQVTITDGITPANYTFTPSNAQWNRFRVPYDIGPTSAAQTITITCMNPGTAVFDGFMWTKGRMPFAFKPSGMMLPIFRDFVHVGAIAAVNMTRNGTLLDLHQIDEPCIMHKIHIYNITPPGLGIVDTYNVLQNGAVSALSGTIGGLSNNAANHLPAGVAFSPGDRIGVAMAPGVSAAADIGVVVSGIRIGY